MEQRKYMGECAPQMRPPDPPRTFAEALDCEIENAAASLSDAAYGAERLVAAKRFYDRLSPHERAFFDKVPDYDRVRVVLSTMDWVNHVCETRSFPEKARPEKFVPVDPAA